MQEFRGTGSFNTPKELLGRLLSGKGGYYREGGARHAKSQLCLKVLIGELFRARWSQKNSLNQRLKAIQKHIRMMYPVLRTEYTEEID